MTKTFDELALHYDTDKSSKAHNFGPAYERFLSPLRETATSVLEVGVYRGASLKLWRDYFPAARIVGVDIHPRAVHKVSDPRVKIELGDQGDACFLLRLGRDYGPFDLLVDDGSHKWRHQILFYKTLWPFLKPGGIMAIEDMHTSFMRHKRTPATPRPSNFFGEIAKSLCRYPTNAEPAEVYFYNKLLILVKGLKPSE